MVYHTKASILLINNIITWVRLSNQLTLFKTIQMKKYFLILIYSLIIITTNAQTFERIIKNSSDDCVYDATFLGDSSAIFAYNHGEYLINYQTNIFKMNIYTGLISDTLNINFSHYNDYNLNSISEIIPFHDTCFILFGNAENKYTGDKQLYICHINNNLEKTYDTLTGEINNNDSFYDFYINTSDRIIAAGSIISTTLINKKKASSFPLSSMHEFSTKDNYNLLVVEMDIWGNKIQRGLLNGRFGLGLSIIEIPGQNCYHFHQRNNDHLFTIINNQTLEIENYTEYPFGFMPRMSFHGNNDTTFYIAGRHTSGLKEDIRNLSFLEINHYGEIMNQHIYNVDSNILYSFKTFDVNNEHIYFGTNIPFNEPSLFQARARWILMYKLELSGEVIWQRFYNNGSVNYMPYRILATPDGGALIFSTRYDWNDPYTYQRDVHILKIDSDGNYIPVGMDKPKTNMKQILVYPNPTKDKINFSFGLYNGLTINIYNLQGTQVFSKLFNHSPTIDLSTFASGIYIYTISNEKGFFERGKIVVE